MLKRYGGDAPSLKAIENVCELKDYVKYTDLLEMIPGIKDKQAHRLGSNSWQFSAGVCFGGIMFFRVTFCEIAWVDYNVMSCSSLSKQAVK